MANSIKLQTDSILQVPLQNYQKDFTFIVNSERFETSTFAAELLSAQISKIHLSDPTINKFSLNTETQGDFNKIIKLINFEKQQFSEEDLPYITEIIETLEINKILIDIKSENEEISLDNFFSLLKKRQEHPKFYSRKLKDDVSFFISHFHDLQEDLLRKIKEGDFDIDFSIIEEVIRDPKLVLETEDELVEVVNELYKSDVKYSILYDYVEFINVSASCMKGFIEKFDFNDLDSRTWSSIAVRLGQEIVKDESVEGRHEYLSPRFLVEILPKNDEFDGIFNYLQTHGNIKDELSITYSSSYGEDPFVLLQYENKDNFFRTKNVPNSWFCFEFRNHQVIPTDYIIRSRSYENNFHPKTWKVEGSTDNKDWIPLDSQTNNDKLKGASRVHLFHISSSQYKNVPLKYIRLQQTGPNWLNNNDSDHEFKMNSIEFYGKII